MLDPTEKKMIPKDSSYKQMGGSDCSSFSSSGRKAVRFASSLQHYETLCRDDYTESEVENSWYSTAEQKQMKINQDKLVKRMDKGKKPKSNESFRGMERLVVDGYQEMMQRKHRCIDSVMDEQERQWKLDIFDWDQMAELAIDSSQECIAQALKLAEEDEVEAKKALKRPWLRSDSSHSESSGSSHSESTDCSDISFTLRRQLSKPSMSKPSSKSNKSRRSSRSKQTKRMDPPGKTLPMQKTISYIKVTSPYLSPSHFELRSFTSSVAA